MSFPLAPRFVLGVFVLFPLAFISQDAEAQLIAALPTDQTTSLPEQPVPFLISARPVPQPSLRFQLLPSVADQRPGNATVWYGKVKAEQNRFFSDRETWDQIHQALDSPLDRMGDFEILNYLAGENNTLFYFLEKGGQCEVCNWQLPIRDGQFYLILLPEIQETRTFARLLAARAKKQIFDRDYDEAIRTLRCGFALGKNVSHSPTIVSGLVGQAIVGMMLEQIELLIQQPDSPNLYWALTSLPANLAAPDMGMRAERDAILLSVPELKKVEQLGGDADYWNQQFDRLMQQVDFLGSQRRRTPLTQEAAARSLLVRGYPLARDVLLKRGWNKERIEAMPVAQAVLAAALYQQQILSDQRLRRYYLSYPEAEAARKAAGREGKKINGHPAVLPLDEFFSPAVDAVITVRTRLERRIARLRVFEALRIYAAEHGSLPDNLSDIRSVAIPTDPATGTPFDYQLKEGVAHLWGPSLPGGPSHFELRLRNSP